MYTLIFIVMFNKSPVILSMGVISIVLCMYSKLGNLNIGVGESQEATSPLQWMAMTIKLARYRPFGAVTSKSTVTVESVVFLSKIHLYSIGHTAN